MLLLANDSIAGVSFALIGIIAAVLFAVIFSFAVFKRLKKCPVGKVLVVYGKQKNGEDGIRIYTKGAVFVWPIIQDFDYLDLTPFSLDAKLDGILSKDNARIDVRLRYVAEISQDSNLLEIAANRIMGNKREVVESILNDMVESKLRLVVGSYQEQELSSANEVFLNDVKKGFEEDFAQIGMMPVTVNVTEIKIKN